MSAAELTDLIARVNALYQQRHILTAQAALPPQANDGTLRIDLIEGRLGRTTLIGNHDVRPAYLRHQLHLNPGEVVDPDALQAALWRFNRLSEIQLSATLAPGDAVGQTDITLTATPPPRDRLTLFVDNHAYSATGTYEGGLLYRHAGLLGLDDRLSALITGARGAVTGTASYDAPLGYDGTRGGISYGHSLTRIVAGTYAGYGSKGIADSVLGELVQPLYSSRRWLVQGTATAGYSHVRNYLGGILVGRTGTTRGGLGLTIGYQGETRALTVAASAAYGHGAIANGARQADYPLLTGSAALTQTITGPISLSANGAWQWTSASGLPSDLLFQIGGPSTVRGYTQGALAGDKGYYLQGQLNWSLGDIGKAKPSLYAFVDRGHVAASFSQPNGLTAVGVGAGLRVTKTLNLDLSLGHPLQNRSFGPGRLHAFARLTWDVLP